MGGLYVRAEYGLSPQEASPSMNVLSNGHGKMPALYRGWCRPVRHSVVLSLNSCGRTTTRTVTEKGAS